MEFMPENAPAVVLGFLFTCFVLFVAGAVFVHALAVGKHGRAKKVLAGAFVWVGIYFVLLLTNSLTSHERVLGPGEQKYFCEVDCHLAYSVVNVATAKTLGTGADQGTAAGIYYVVILKTWFDERTISNRRARNMPLSPNLRMVTVVDDLGREFGTSLEGLKALDQPAAQMVPLTQPLRPGESYETTLVFDLPSDVKNPRLLLTDPIPVNWLLIGHENSFLHKKIFFRLELESRPAAANTVS